MPPWLPHLVLPAIEVSPVALAQGTIHPGGLLIKTMCGVAGQGGGSSGSQAWPVACGLWEGWRKGLADPQVYQVGNALGQD
jgi:hypothetical protein